MSEISLATIARALDSLLDGQMTAQARIAAHLLVAAEAAGHDTEYILKSLDAIVASTVLDEIWITDEHGVAYLTTVRDETGARVAFRFDPDPSVQPQASPFYSLLASSPDSDNAVAQPARVREIDHEIFKYVGVNGVDRHRIVQVGNAPAFDEQDVLSNAYTSPVMTAVMAAFGEPDLLSNSFTNRLAEIRIVLEGILGKQMIVQATLVDYFVTNAEEAGWSTEEICSRLRRIVDSTVIGEIHVVNPGGEAAYSNLPSALASRFPDGLPHAGDLASLLQGTAEGTTEVVHEIAPHGSDGLPYKYVSLASAHSARLVQVGFPIESNSPLSLGLVSAPSSAGDAGSADAPEGQA